MRIIITRPAREADMFLAQLEKEKRDAVIRDFHTADVSGIPAFVMHDGVKTDNLILLYNQETEAFWALRVPLFHEGRTEEAEKMDQIGVYWKLIRETYRSEQKGLVYKRIGAKAYVYGMEKFHANHPYTAREIILWDSEQMDHLLMKYDRDVVEVSFAIQYLLYPQIEKLYKAGFEDIILNWVMRDRYTPKDTTLFEECFTNARTIRQITSFSKGQWSQLITFKLDLDEWVWIRRVLNAYKISDANVAPLVRMVIRGEDSFCKSFVKITRCTVDGQPAYDADQLIRDLVNDHGNTEMSPERACIYLADYIRMAERNHMEPDYRTERLREEHDLMTIIQQEKKQQKNDEETQKIYDARYEELKIYLYETDELMVVLPKKFSDIISEGRNNHNCVGSLYVHRYEKGTSNIFFIREKENLYRSYITVELNKKCDKTIQAFYSHNRRITKKRDLQFIEDWLQANKTANRRKRVSSV